MIERLHNMIDGFFYTKIFNKNMRVKWPGS